MYVTDNMDPAMKKEIEFKVTDYYTTRDHDWMTQITVFQYLIKHAIPA